MHAVTTSPLFLYPSIPTRRTAAGDLPREYLLEYIVWEVNRHVTVLPAGVGTYAVAVKPDWVRRYDLTQALLSDIPFARVIACIPSMATLYMPLATSIAEVVEEIACACSAVHACAETITADLQKFEMEMGYELEVDYRLDEAA
jgi:hypothetical protein